MMNKTTENFSEATVQTIDTAREFMQTSLESIEKMTRLNLDASKRILDETSQALKEMSSVNNPKDLLNRVNQLASSSVESNMCNCRDLYEILTEAQSKISKMFEIQIQATQKNVTSAVEGLSQLNPKSTVASESIKNWLNGANQAMNTMNKMASQVTEFTNNNIK
ncbi:MAG: phasin family protein, partial [Burkholderiales bacterium]